MAAKTVEKRANSPQVEPSPIRVFISSTFRDMHAERDHLVTVVFPELRERIERLGKIFRNFILIKPS